jgi:hypothetical protein
MSITQVIDTLPAAPDPATDLPAAFSTKAAASVLAQKAMVPQINTWSGQANALAADVNADSLLAQEAAVAAALASGVEIWVSGTTYTVGDQRYSSTDFQTYRRKTNGAGTTDPISDPTNWAAATVRTGTGAPVIDQRTTITIIGSADLSHFIEFTASTATDLTQTIGQVAGLPSGFFFWIKNASAKTITLSPYAGDTIDGLAGYKMFPGEGRLFLKQSSTNLSTQVFHAFYREITVTEVDMPIPPGYTAFGGYLWSAGASGQRTNNVAVVSLGGPGGGCFPFLIPANLFSATETITIGSGGAAVTGVADGNIGGNSSIGSILTVYGAQFSYGGSVVSGLYVVSSPANFEGMSNTGSPRGTIYGGGAPQSDGAADGNNSLYGGAPGGSLTASAVVRAPGTSQFGGDGGVAHSTTSGEVGTGPGAGGGATQTGTASGPGTDGKCIMYGVM